MNIYIKIALNIFINILFSYLIYNILKILFIVTNLLYFIKKIV